MVCGIHLDICAHIDNNKKNMFKFICQQSTSSAFHPRALCKTVECTLTCLASGVRKKWRCLALVGGGGGGKKGREIAKED